MAKTSNTLVVQIVVLVMVIAMVGEATAATICNVDTSKLNLCLPALSGKSPPRPTNRCCKVMHIVNMPCLCKYKSVLPAIGIDPARAMALPKKCGLALPRPCLEA